MFSDGDFVCARRELARCYSERVLEDMVRMIDEDWARDEDLVVLRQVVEDAACLRRATQCRIDEMRALAEQKPLCLCQPLMKMTRRLKLIPAQVESLLVEMDTEEVPCVCHTHGIATDAMYPSVPRSQTGLQSQEAGSFASVYSVRRARLSKESVGCGEGNLLALKVIDWSSERDDERKKRRAMWSVANEVRALSVVAGHPNIVRIYDALVDDHAEHRRAALVLEYAPAGNVWQVLENAPKSLQLCELDIRTIARDVLCALKHLAAHGFAHRDLKPSNMVCTASHPASHAFSVKLCDFGFCERFDTAREHNQTVKPSSSAMPPPRKPSRDAAQLDFRGSARYIAPEVVLGLRIDGSVDIWSLGVVLHVLLLGLWPYGGQSRAELLRNIVDGRLQPCGDASWARVSPEARRLVQRMLLNTPAYRINAKEALSHDWFGHHEDGLKRNTLRHDWGRIRASTCP